LAGFVFTRPPSGGCSRAFAADVRLNGAGGSPRGCGPWTRSSASRSGAAAAAGSRGSLRRRIRPRCFRRWIRRRGPGGGSTSSRRCGPGSWRAPRAEMPRQPAARVAACGGGPRGRHPARVPRPRGPTNGGACSNLGPF
jgi:hypothetical protein